MSAQNVLRANGPQMKLTVIATIEASNPDRMDLADMVELSALGRIVEKEYETLGLEVPESLALSLKSLRREIKTRSLDSLEKTLREKKARLQAMLPVEEKRKQIEAEIAELKSKLATV